MPGSVLPTRMTADSTTPLDQLPITRLRGVGSQLSERLARIGVATVWNQWNQCGINGVRLESMWNQWGQTRLIHKAD